MVVEILSCGAYVSFNDLLFSRLRPRGIPIHHTTIVLFRVNVQRYKQGKRANLRMSGGLKTIVEVVVQPEMGPVETPVGAGTYSGNLDQYHPVSNENNNDSGRTQHRGHEVTTAGDYNTNYSDSNNNNN